MDRYIVTLSGKQISLAALVGPDIRDIAVSHCRTPMYAGHSNLFYTVAHHCLSAAELAANESPEVAYFTLLHEVETAVFGDVPGPVKCAEQRSHEKALRERVYYELGTPLPDKIWDRVEFYDKLEQAAAITWLGLPETVHDAVWDSATVRQQDDALKVTRDNYRRYPPAKNLDVDSPMMTAFIRDYKIYRARMARDKPR